MIHNTSNPEGQLRAHPGISTLPSRLSDLSHQFIAAETLLSFRHGLLNKLAGIGNLSYLLRHKMDALSLADPELAESFRLMSHEIAEAASLLDRKILAAPLACPPLDIVQAVGTLLYTMVPPANIRIVPPQKLSLSAQVDDGELMLCLSCLIENALDSLKDKGGGTVTVTCAQTDEGHISIDITDDGQGLGEEALHRLYEHFFTTKQGHVGLGLNVSRRIAGRWHAHLEVSARSEGGVCARLVLPGTQGHAA